jgi:SAM-dependent methyltransferase
MNCPVCLGSEISLEGIVDRFNPPLNIQKCQSCLSLFQYPVPPDHLKFYNEDYYSGKSAFSYIDERKANVFNKYVWDARIKNILKFQHNGVFIDIGCSFGGLVRSASPYFQSYGVDISAYSIKLGNEFSLQTTTSPGFKGLFQGSLLEIPPVISNLSSVSVITLIEVIEHLENPREHIQKAFELLKPGGLLVIQTANMTAYQAVSRRLDYHYYLPGHLTYFSREGMLQMLHGIGFSNFREYFPVDFGLIPKLKKLSGSVNKPRDLAKYWKTTWYHLKSFLNKDNRPLTSSYVIYAFK